MAASTGTRVVDSALFHRPVAPMPTSALQTNLGSTFIKAAFLAELSAGLALNIYAGVHTARYAGTFPGYSHGADAAKPLASVLSRAHEICAEYSVTDDASLSEMLEAIQELLDCTLPQGDWDWSAADQALAKPALDHVFSDASQKARDALAEVEAGFAVSGGDLGGWQQEMAHQAAMRQSVTWSKEG